MSASLLPPGIYFPDFNFRNKSKEIEKSDSTTKTVDLLFEIVEDQDYYRCFSFMAPDCIKRLPDKTARKAAFLTHIQQPADPSQSLELRVLKLIHLICQDIDDKKLTFDDLPYHNAPHTRDVMTSGAEQSILRKKLGLEPRTLLQEITRTAGDTFHDLMHPGKLKNPKPFEREERAVKAFTLYLDAACIGPQYHQNLEDGESDRLFIDKLTLMIYGTDIHTKPRLADGVRELIDNEELQDFNPIHIHPAIPEDKRYLLKAPFAREMAEAIAELCDDDLVPSFGWDIEKQQDNARKLSEENQEDVTSKASTAAFLDFALRQGYISKTAQAYDKNLRNIRFQCFDIVSKDIVDPERVIRPPLIRDREYCLKGGDYFKRNKALTTSTDRQVGGTKDTGLPVSWYPWQIEARDAVPQPTR